MLRLFVLGCCFSTEPEPELLSRRAFDGAHMSQGTSFDDAAHLLDKAATWSGARLMQHKVVVFHSAQGVRRGLLEWAELLRAAGHKAHIPDLYDGDVFNDAGDAVAKIQQLGFEELFQRSGRAVADLPNDLVYVGLSYGGACAELLGATTRPGARGVVLVGAPLPIRDLGWTVWPDRSPVQVHFGKADPRRNERVIDALGTLVRSAGGSLTQYVPDRNASFRRSASRRVRPAVSSVDVGACPRIHWASLAAALPSCAPCRKQLRHDGP